MADLEDPEGLRSEAEAQSEATLMPWIWLAIGLLVIAVFVAWTIFAEPHAILRHPPAAAPLTRPLHQGY
ncbi:MAG TPA: hypothetical protein VGG29_11690 [Caulobacteraceae bacterium]|jgi:hypothetical protein